MAGSAVSASSSSDKTPLVATTATSHDHGRLRKLQFPSDMPELPTWAQGWLNDTIVNTDWSNENAWMDWFTSLSSESQLLDNFDICPLLETAVGMGQAFGIEANCRCTGNMTTSMKLSCAFDQCVDTSTIVDEITAEATSRQADSAGTRCGSIGLNITFGGNSGTVTTTVCADFPNEQYRETCFSYEVSMIPGSPPKQSCTASYGGLECDCSIDNTFCLNVNCSSYLPGAALDTCQVLSMQDEKDLMSWLPQFQVFASDFALGTFRWTSISWFVLCRFC